jgi:hypothetical protein
VKSVLSWSSLEIASNAPADKTECPPLQGKIISLIIFSLRHCRPPLQENLGRSSPFNVSYQHCCKKNINVNDSQNLAFTTAHFVIELLPFDYLRNLPCNFEVNLITHLGVIALFSSIFFKF